MLFSRINDGVLARYASVTRALGSPFVARVLEAGQRQLHHAPATMQMIATWPGDPVRAAVAMRFNGALHALARRGSIPALTRLYTARKGDFDAPIREALSLQDEFIAAWMQRPPQTNEVGRSAALAGALMLAAEEFGLPFELLELGSSAGLNLNLGRYSFDLGGVETGESGSTVRIAPQWRGGAIRPAPIHILSARGVDLDPLDAAEEATSDRLLAYIWADRPQRAQRLEHAIAIARAHPPRIDQADAASWIEQRLSDPQDDGVCRVVFHSMVLQYLNAEDRVRVRGAIEAAAARATRRQPLLWISYEWNEARTEVVLLMKSWPDGRARDLARCHAYADWIDWKAR